AVRWRRWRRRSWRQGRWVRPCRGAGSRCSASRAHTITRGRSAPGSRARAGGAGRSGHYVAPRSACGSARCRSSRGWVRGSEHDGAWPSGKARDFGSRIRRFESSRPNHTNRNEATMAYERTLLPATATRPLAEEIAQSLHAPMAAAEVTRFSDGEVYVQVDENVRGADVFLIQPTCPPVNDTLMELLILTDAMKRASARRITAVLPYYGYARQDRKVQSRVPTSARLVADLLEAAGIQRVLALDLHAGQIQGFFSVPVDHLFAGPVVMIDYLRKKDPRDPVIVAPDAGGVERARAMAKRFDAG